MKSPIYGPIVSLLLYITSLLRPPLYTIKCQCKVVIFDNDFSCGFKNPCTGKFYDIEVGLMLAGFLDL